MYSSDSGSAYSFGNSVKDEQISIVTANKRVHIFSGVPANKYYTFGIQAYRSVDQDVNASGALYSNIVKSSVSLENPYQPSINIAFDGDITGTIDGKPTSEIIDSINATDGFINITYPNDLTGIQNQIDGKITTWFQEADPNTWAVADRVKHNGDLWYKASTKSLKRYNSSTNLWQAIEDQAAIDAYNMAAQAQDTADGKRTVFVTTPYPPYEIGDLWTQDSNSIIKVCIVAKSAGGSFAESDWRLATEDVKHEGKVVNDENVTAYFPLNGNLRDSRGVFEGTFTRASSACLSDGTQLSNDIPRFEKAKVGDGIFMETSTTNLVTNGECETDAPKLGNNISFNLVLISLNETQKHSGDKSLRMININTTGSSDRYFQIGSATSMNGLIAGQTYTCSAWVYVPSGSGINLNNVFIRAYRNYPTGGGYVPGTKPNKYDTWQRIWVTWTSDINDTSMYFRFYINQDIGLATIYLDDIQVEQKSFATSFVPSSRGIERLTIPTNNIIQKDSFSVDLIYTPTINSSVLGNSSRLWDLRISSTNYYELWSSSSQILFYICSGGTIKTIAFKSIELLAGVSYTISISVNISTASLFLNGELVGTQSYTAPIGNLPLTMSIGNRSNSTLYPACGTFDELRFSKVARTLAEHQEFYNSNGFTDGETIVRTDTKYNNVVINPLDGIKCVHEDGSYTQMRAEGLKRFVPKSVYTERSLPANRYTFSTGVLSDYFTIYGGTSYTEITTLPLVGETPTPVNFPADITKGFWFDRDDRFVRLSTVKTISKDCTGYLWYYYNAAPEDGTEFSVLANGVKVLEISARQNDSNDEIWTKANLVLKKGTNIIDIIATTDAHGAKFFVTDIMFEPSPVEYIYAGKSRETGTEYLYLTHIGSIYCDYSYVNGNTPSAGGGGLIDIPIQLPEEFKNKDFKIVFAASDVYFSGNLYGFGVYETDRDVANAIVYVKAFAQSDTTIQGVTFSYFVIA